MDFKNLKKKIRELKVSRKPYPRVYKFKNLQKIYGLAYGFLFFVISISGIFTAPLTPK
jgi:hypothetical protein